MENKLSFATAFMATAFATMPANSADNNGEAHGWDVPELAEFVMEDVNTMLLLPPPVSYISRDVHVDCDLLVRPGNARDLQEAMPYPTVGFAIQFNAESQYTYEAFKQIDRSNNLPEGTTAGRLQGWVGQMDYRGSSIEGVMGHLISQHGIPTTIVQQAYKTCIEDHPEHGVSEFSLNQAVTPKFKIHEDWVEHRQDLGLNSP
jgi:hypothetical protein